MKGLESLIVMFRLAHIELIRVCVKISTFTIISILHTYFIFIFILAFLHLRLHYLTNEKNKLIYLYDKLYQKLT